MSTRDERMGEILRGLAARFLLVNGNNSSLLTVTHVNLTDKGKYATILFTVFPESFEKTALEFAKRKRGEFREFIKENSKLGRIPQIDFDIDSGEKNRQRIDSLLNEDNKA
jgi:ribosome-binding factor A